MLLLLPVSLAFSTTSSANPSNFLHRCSIRAAAAARQTSAINGTASSRTNRRFRHGRGKRQLSCRDNPFFSHRTTSSSFLLMSGVDVMATSSGGKTATSVDDPADEKTMEDDEEEAEEESIDEGQLLNDGDATATVDELYPRGIPDTNSIVRHATVPHPSGFDPSRISAAFSAEDVERLKLRPDNVTVPAALLLLFPDLFGSQTKARKESRRRKILVHRGPLIKGEGGKEEFDPDRLVLGRVIDRVKPGDTVAIQTRMSHNYAECKNHHSSPPFALPVVYQDDHMAVVNKPEGVVVFSHKNGGYGRHNVKSCLPWVLEPPRAGVVSVMRRPNPVHRIDRGTSGLLVVAKTKPAMVGLARMFRERKVKKTYTAIVGGDIQEPKETSITSDDAKKLGVCIGDEDSNSKETPWQIIEDELEGQSAVTIWRPLRRWRLENARNDTASLVELKPKTGRYHQLRRHMAWTSNCPLIGDKSYDGGGLAKTLRDRGFYLCSNKVTLEHPYYNTRTPEGRKEWEVDKKGILKGIGGLYGETCIMEEEDGTILIHCKIDLPAKFSELEVGLQEDKIK